MFLLYPFIISAKYRISDANNVSSITKPFGPCKISVPIDKIKLNHHVLSIESSRPTPHMFHKTPSKPDVSRYLIITKMTGLAICTNADSRYIFIPPGSCLQILFYLLGYITVFLTCSCNWDAGYNVCEFWLRINIRYEVHLSALRKRLEPSFEMQGQRMYFCNY